MISGRHLRMAARFAAHRWRPPHVYEVQAALLNACNLRCLYCHCPESRSEVLTTAEWVAVIRALRRQGTVRIKFQGGEPTLRRDFAELAAASRAAGIRTGVVTNGYRIAEEPDLLDRLDEVVFSLDSPRPEINDRLRGEGCHARVIEALGHARDRRVARFINMVVSRHNRDDLEAMLELCERYGALLNAQPVLTGWTYSHPEAAALALDEDEARELFRRQAQLQSEGRAVMFSTATYRHAENWPAFEEAPVRSSGLSSCMAGRYYVHIEPNGDVHPCAHHVSGLEPRNVVKDGVEEALLHARRHDCGDCWLPYLNERKALAAFRPSALRGFLARG